MFIHIVKIEVTTSRRCGGILGSCCSRCFSADMGMSRCFQPYWGCGGREVVVAFCSIFWEGVVTLM